MLSLCSGIGGLDLAAEWAGWSVAGQVELDPYCQTILRRHWPQVPLVSDLRDVEGDTFARPITLLAGGVPCQPFSEAGDRRGILDPRHLWPEMRRIAALYQPTWLLIENVTGFLTLALDDVLDDLGAAGYEAQTFVLPAAALGAPHRRERVFVVAYADRQALARLALGRGGQGRAAAPDAGGDVVRPDDGAQAPADPAPDGARDRAAHAGVADRQSAAAQSRMGRMLDGLSRGLDRSLDDSLTPPRHAWPAGPGESPYPYEPPRTSAGEAWREQRLKALGNAVVPQHAYPILRAMYLAHQLASGHEGGCDL